MAMYFVGKMLIDGGQSINPNIRKGHSPIRNSADKNNNLAIWYLIEKYITKSKIGKNIKLAIKFANKLCNQNNYKACAKAADLDMEQPNIKKRKEGCQIRKELYNKSGEINSAYYVARCVIKGIPDGQKDEIQEPLKVAIKSHKNPLMQFAVLMSAMLPKADIQRIRAYYL